MKYKYPSKYKKMIKKTAQTIDGALKIKNYIKNPGKSLASDIINNLKNMNTIRKSKGMQKNRAQSYNKRINRFVKRDTKTGKIVGVRKKKGVPYKNVRIV